MPTNIINLCKRYIHLISIFLLILLILNSYNLFLLDLFFYILLHILFIYLIFFYDNKINYYTTFLIAFILDLYLVNNFGPHLIIFLLMFTIIKKFKIFFNNKNPQYLIFANLIIIYIMLVLETIIWIIFYDNSLNLYVLINYFIVLILIYYPSYFVLKLIKF